MMDYARWIDHVVECLESRVLDTEEEARVHERGLPGVYYDVVWAEYHDDVRNTTLDEMVAMDMRNGSLGEYRYSRAREVLEECRVDTLAWADDYCMERYRLLMARTIRQLSEDECVIRGYGGYATQYLTIRYV